MSEEISPLEDALIYAKEWRKHSVHRSPDSVVDGLERMVGNLADEVHRPRARLAEVEAERDAKEICLQEARRLLIAAEAALADSRKSHAVTLTVLKNADAVLAETRAYWDNSRNVAIRAERERDEARAENAALAAKVKELRGFLDACHLAVGEDPGSDDATLADGIAMRVSDLHAAASREKALAGRVALMRDFIEEWVKCRCEPETDCRKCELLSRLTAAPEPTLIGVECVEHQAKPGEHCPCTKPKSAPEKKPCGECHGGKKVPRRGWSAYADRPDLFIPCPECCPPSPGKANKEDRK